ncbi:MAG: sugar phosphate nucleotidyltransferase [bacterium]
MSMNRVLAMLLAGGQGSRLSLLCQNRAKPAVPFAGVYRIIDFTVSNVMNAGIPYLGITTQFRPYSLHNHLGSGEAWGFVGRNRMARTLPPYKGEADSDWYANTADAITQNLNFIKRFDVDIILVLSGDHIYQMDYARLIEYHREKKAELTIATQPVAWEETSRFGLMITNENGKIVGFQEKPKSNPISNLASLGIYVFNRDILFSRLREDAADPDSQHDFGRNVIPAMIEKNRVYSYKFEDYWRDVGTVDSYWNTNLEALRSESGLRIREWRLRTNMKLRPLRELRPMQILSGGKLKGSIASCGSVVEGEVVNSVLSPGVRVGRDAHVENCVLLDNVDVGKGARLRDLVADKNVVMEDGCVVGEGDEAANRRFPHLFNTGVSLIGKGARLPGGFAVGRNCLIAGGLAPGDFPSRGLASGETLLAAITRS